MKSDEIRTRFLEYFRKREHKIVPSSSLIPHKDPTLLFTNAGMNQFKDVFLGKEKRPYARAASSQKCMRAGGKHNDLDNVGLTDKHHTFFEMLGNFSFGDYFKKEAIEMGWELLIDGYGLPPERMLVSVYQKDDEAYNIWNKNIGLHPSIIYRLGEKDNFWAMGDTGPCGPCSEIHYDRGKEFGCGRPDCSIECDCDRFFELWNLVFMQYNRDEKGELSPLPSPCIDTGMGLERLATLLQGAKSNYESDLFQPIVERLLELGNLEQGASRKEDIAIRIIADHLRAITFAVSDGVMPSNEGRGYVLRRIIRRAIRQGQLLGFTEPFLYKMTGLVAHIMKNPFPELMDSRDFVARVCLAEEERFHTTLTQGIRQVEDVLEKVESSKGTIVPGSELFRLYDTFGVPLDLVEEIAAERGLTVDHQGFQKHLEGQREKAHIAWLEGIENIKEFSQTISILGKTIAGKWAEASQMMSTLGKTIEEQLGSVSLNLSNEIEDALKELHRKAEPLAKTLAKMKKTSLILSEEVVEKLNEPYQRLVQSVKTLDELLKKDMLDRPEKIDKDKEAFLKLFPYLLNAMEKQRKKPSAGWSQEMEKDKVAQMLFPYWLKFQEEQKEKARPFLVEDVEKDKVAQMLFPYWLKFQEEQLKKTRRALDKGVKKFKEAYRKLVTQTKTTFAGYETTFLEDVSIVAIIKGSQQVERLGKGEEGEVILDRTPFYAQAGGQVGDKGTLSSDSGTALVTDTLYATEDMIVHLVKVRHGELVTGEKVAAEVNKEDRAATAANHTATHLLQATLREHLGTHIKQSGSEVTPDKMRFDFTHFSPITPRELRRIEEAVNKRIRENLPVKTEVVDYNQAIAKGAIALFGEKYHEKVRMVSINDISRELCGGTHTRFTGDIGAFLILSECGIAAGVRRIEALTGREAIKRIQQRDETIEELSQLLKTEPQQIVAQVEKLMETGKKSQKELERLRLKLASGGGEAPMEERLIQGVKVVAQKLMDFDPSSLRNYSDVVKSRIKSGVVVLGSHFNNKASLLVALTPDLTNRLNAVTIIRDIAKIVGGGGGGRSDMAQAGGKLPEKLDLALEESYKVIEKHLIKGNS